jgi:hypothetical protein
MAPKTAQSTEREPRIALGVALRRVRPGLASIADVAAALSVVTALIGDQDDLPPLDVVDALNSPIFALAVIELDGAPLVISGGETGALRSWRLDGTPGKLQVTGAHLGEILALAVAQQDGAQVVISGGSDRALRSWRPDGTPGELQISNAGSRGATSALVIVEHDGAPLVISGGGWDGTLRSWRLDGTPGEFQISDARGTIRALAVVRHGAAPLVIGGGWALRSWRLDGAPGELQISGAHLGGVGALAVVRHDGAPLVISGGSEDGALRSWRLDGTPGDLQADDAHVGGTIALAVVRHDGAPLLVSADGYGTLRSWSLASSLTALERPTARALEVRELSLGSLELVVLLPPGVLTAAGVAAAGSATGVAVMKLSKLLDAIKRVAGFPAELRIQARKLQTEALIAEAELLDAADQLAEARARQRRRQLDDAGWEVERIVVTDDADVTR